ncbi:MAG: preprotein translocase subunit YajC [Sphingobacteriales bacterium]|jgi:preprotein translocase subunit YajC|nr:preprotein translocase subunit YajC [Sphingobacteriales bacterium]
MLNTFLFIAQAGGAGSAQLLLIGGIFVIMYFFMIRPQQKRMAEHKDFIANLKKGDKIVTTGGIHGKIVRVDDRVFLVEIDKNTMVNLEKSFVSVEQSKSIQEPTSVVETSGK